MELRQDTKKVTIDFRKWRDQIKIVASGGILPLDSPVDFSELISKYGEAFGEETAMSPFVAERSLAASEAVGGPVTLVMDYNCFDFTVYHIDAPGLKLGFFLVSSEDGSVLEYDDEAQLALRIARAERERAEI